MDRGDVYEVAGRELSCQHCRHRGFLQTKKLLNSRLNTFFDLDFLDRSATILVCTRCGFLHWFLPRLAEI